MISNPSVELTNPTLFGNDAAEDEREDIFNSYAYERPEVDLFADPSRALCIVRAYKGEGKSALLRLTQRRIRKLKDDRIVLSKTASDLAPEVAKDDYAAWVRAWKAAIFGMFAVEIGSQIGVAWSDDAMSLVEEAEKTGFKQRSFVSSILSRLKMPAEVAPIPEQEKLGVTNATETVKRWANGKLQLWLFVDDVDKNFRDTTADKVRVASFFDACREAINSVPELRIRTAIRPNVWTIVRLEFESLSHVEQYATNLQWTEGDVRTLLARRVEGYLKRVGAWNTFSRTLENFNTELREKDIIATAFEPVMRWGNTTRPPHLLLYTLSKHRPRWVIELAKVAAAAAALDQHIRITHDDIIGQLTAFGARRIEDTVAEFKSQCPEIQELVGAFTREKEQLSTDELVRIISNKILTHLSPRIAGVTGRPSALQVAALLFEIGLFYGRREHKNGEYEHFGFSDRPSLLKSRTDIDAGLTWEIHPVFRQALEMRDASGAERVRVRSRPPDPRR